MKPQAFLQLSPLQRLAYWINERENIRQKKDGGLPPPWTDDPILAAYRFTNVHREHDRVTRWLRDQWRIPHARDPHLWHAMVVARFINWPETLQVCGYPEPWPQRHAEFARRLRLRKIAACKVFTGAYIVGTNGVACDKVEHVLRVFDNAWNISALPQTGDTLAIAHRKLLAVEHFGSFMAAQVVADLKYTPMLRRAADWHVWAAPGPGSVRGLNRVRHRLPLDAGWDQRAFIAELRRLREDLAKCGAPYLYDLQDLQNCLCEFSKFERTLHGEGHPRAKYVAFVEQDPLAA
jgi:hypothetical protein